MNKLREATGAIIIFAILLLLVWDFYVWLTGGYRVTISWLINNWIFDSTPMIWIGLGAVLGGLLVHFAGWAPGPRKDTNDG